MRTRTIFSVSALVATCFAFGPSATADPLDLDHSFGKDGSVSVSYQGLSTMTALATHGQRSYAAGGNIGAGSYDHAIAVQVRGRHGHEIRGRTETVHLGGSYADIRDVIAWQHRVFLIGWQSNYNWETKKRMPVYGFVSAFRGSLKGNLQWGTGRYFNSKKTGIERLREFDFASVSGGAVDQQGRVLVTGRIDGQAGVVRLTRDGRIDTSYGSHGLAQISIGAGSNPTDIAVQGTSAMVVGSARFGQGKQAFAAKLTDSGVRDRSFSGDGIRRIGQPHSAAAAVDQADAGRWLVAYQTPRHAVVSKLGASGDLIRSFGRHGRAGLPCNRPPGHRVIDGLTVDQRNGTLHRIALATSCKRNGEVRNRVAVWQPGGKPIRSLKPDGVASVPWDQATQDIAYGLHHRLMGLTNSYLYRLR